MMRQYNWPLLALVVVLLSFLALRPYLPHVAGDWSAYRTMYTMGDLGLGRYERDGWLFRWLCLGGKALGLSAEWFFFLLSSVGLLIKAVTGKQIVGRFGLPAWTVAFLLLPGFFLQDFIQIRTGLAQALLLAALWSVVNRRWFLAGGLSLAAVGFHSSSVFFLPILFVPTLAIAGYVIVMVALAHLHVEYQQFFWSLRGVGVEATDIPLSMAKILGIAGGYAGLMLIGEWLRRKYPEIASVLRATQWVVLGSLVLHLGMHVLPYVPSALVVRAHQAGWFGVACMLMLLARDRRLALAVSGPVTIFFTIYYARIAFQLGA